MKKENIYEIVYTSKFLNKEGHYIEGHKQLVVGETRIDAINVLLNYLNVEGEQIIKIFSIKKGK